MELCKQSSPQTCVSSADLGAGIESPSHLVVRASGVNPALFFLCERAVSPTSPAFSNVSILWLRGVVLAAWGSVGQIVCVLLQMLAYFSMLHTQLWERQATAGLLLRRLLASLLPPDERFDDDPYWRQVRP